MKPPPSIPASAAPAWPSLLAALKESGRGLIGDATTAFQKRVMVERHYQRLVLARRYGLDSHSKRNIEQTEDRNVMSLAVAEVLQGIRQRSAATPRERVESKVREVLGTRLAGRVTIEDVKNGTLILSVTHPIYTMEVRGRERALAEALTTEGVRQIRVRVVESMTKVAG